jgi:hypothetical protein
MEVLVRREDRQPFARERSLRCLDSEDERHLAVTEYVQTVLTARRERLFH